MATLVTGGTGFVGANIIRDLARNGHQVVSFDINGPDQLLQDFLGGAASSVTFVQGDIVDPASVGDLGRDHQIEKIGQPEVDTVNREAELGTVIGHRDYWSDGYAHDAVTTLLEHMFTTRKLKRVYRHTLEWNGRAQKSFSKSGFNEVRPVRRMAHDFILMDVLRDDWFETREERLAARFRDPGGAGSQGSPSSQATAD